MKRAAPLLVLVGALLSGCGGSPFPGFKEVGEDVFLRYHRLGEGEVLATDSDSVLLRLRVALHGDDPGTLLSTDRWYDTRDLRAGAFKPVLRRIHEGDSITVIAPQRLWPWPVMSAHKVLPTADTAWLQCELSLMRIKTMAESLAEQDRVRQLDPEAFEQALIEARVKAGGGSWERWGTSWMHYAVHGNVSDTMRANPGDLVIVAWKGRSLTNGAMFDEQAAFTWRYGDPDQVVAGMHAAVGLMRLGQQGSFIMPSSLAFGERGIPGLLEPWSPVEYDVRLVAIERKR